MSPLVINPGSTSGALATDDLTLSSGVAVAYISDMPDTRDVAKITLGAFKRGPGCSQSAPVTLQVREGASTALEDGEMVSTSRESVNFSTSAANVAFEMQPFTMRAGHSYSFIIYHNLSQCVVGTRYTWPHNQTTVTGGNASLCPLFPSPYWKWRIWHINTYDDAPTCFLQTISDFDTSLPTGWLQVGGYGGPAIESYVVSDTEGPLSFPCIPGAQGVYWRPYPYEPEHHEQWACTYTGFSHPSTPMTDGWYFAGSWDEETGGDPRDAYLKLEPPDYQELLEEHAPILAFDSNEDFFPQEASAFTDNGTTVSTYFQAYANQLYSGSTVLAAGGSPGTGSLPPELTLDTLGPTYNLGSSSYPAASSSDFIDANGSSKLAASIDSEHMRTLGYGSVIYGRFVQDPTDRRLWLQYWIFYYYNSFDVAGFGLHEGDWEMVQVGLDSSTLNPVEATFSIHETPGRGCSWSQIAVDEATGLRPGVFVGAGSHASYPDLGDTGISIMGFPTPVNDHHWGDGVVLDSLPVEVANGERWWPGPAGGARRLPAVPTLPAEKPIPARREVDRSSAFADNSDHDHCFGS